MPKRWGRLAAVIGGALAALLPGALRPTLRPAFAAAAEVTANAPANAPDNATPDASDEAEFVADVNQVRAGSGDAALHVDGRLAAEARRWAATMATSGLRHNPDMTADAPPGWTLLGENVGTGGSVGAIEDAFVNSPHHYENMVNSRFDAIGVGVVVDGNVLWVAEEFMAGGGVPAPAPAAPSPAMHHPAPAPAPEPPSVVTVAAPPAPVLQQVSSVLTQLRLLEGFGPGE